MLVAVVCTRHESACCRDHAPALIVVCATGDAMKFRGRGGLKVLARLLLGHSDGKCLPPRLRTCTNCGLRNESRHEAPTWLLCGVRWRRTQGACSFLFFFNTCTDCGLHNGSRHEAPTNWCSSKLAAAMRCYAVRGGGGLKMRARLCRRHSGQECLPPSNQEHAGFFAFATEPPCKLRLMEQACGSCTVQGEGGLKVRACLCR